MMSEQLWELGEKSIRELEDERGILASSKEEIYGCIFGRDSLITALKLLSVYEYAHNEYYLSLVRKILRNLAELQGKEHNIESGEEPGKIIHEYRTASYDHLVSAERPWYLYPDNILRNYDTVDATPLFLMAVYRYWKDSGDYAFVEELLPNVRVALQWVINHGDSNGDGLIDYTFHSDRTHGGLLTQSWMDSEESVFFEGREEKPRYPIAPVEAQAYTYVALRSWGAYFKESDEVYSAQLEERATSLKKVFNEKFIVRTTRSLWLAFAIDGEGKKLVTPRSSMGHCLWAAYFDGEKPDCVIEDHYIEPVRKRLLSADLFVRRAGIRTLSSRSKKFDPLSYHNGSIWPHDTAILAEGLGNFGYLEDAILVRTALLRAYRHFETPIELFAYDKRNYHEYKNPTGAGACRVQAWSAASLLMTLARSREENT